MIFSKKKETILPYSVEECGSCKAISKRKFRDGDYVFKNTNECSSCKGQMSVVKIFGEVFKE
jgi:hypothetical protein